MPIWSTGLTTEKSGRMSLSKIQHLFMAFGLLALWLCSQPALAAEASAQPRCAPQPGEPGWLEFQLQRKEGSLAQRRNEAIRLLKQFLAEHPKASQRADALYRLAELSWEQAEADLLVAMREYERRLEEFRLGQLKKRPPEPSIQLDASILIYEEMLEKHPNFDRCDMVLYLYGFALNEQGDEDTALAIYRSLLKRFPHSTFAADANLAIAEFHFAKAQYKPALKAYARVLAFPKSVLLDLALYKTAWCHFKLGRAKDAAKFFKRVLDRSRKQKTEGNKQASPGGDLEREALEDLALTFSEYGGAKEAYLFMKQVGGEQYSIRVLENLGEVFFRQARYDKAIDSYRMLVQRFPLAKDSPGHQQQIALAFEKEGKLEASLTERNRLADSYGPGSSWAKHHAAKPEVQKMGLGLAENALRYVAMARHKQAQKGTSDKAYKKAEQAYRKYLERFGKTEQAPRIHFYLGEVLFKLKRFDKAAEHYSKAVHSGKEQALKQEAAYAAILAWDKQRDLQPKNEKPPAKPQDLSPAEQGFLRTVNEFTKLAPDDPKLAQLRFEVGRIHHLRGQFPRAAKHLLALVAAKPKGEYSEAAADLALDCYAKAGLWTDVEREARRFDKEGWYRGKDLGGLLKDIMAGAIFQHAASRSKADEHGKAAKEYLRMAQEFPKNERASKALYNAAVAQEKAGEKAQAVKLYQRVIAEYPTRAADALFVIAGIHERQYDYQQASDSFAKFSKQFDSDKRAQDALLQAALLLGALGQFDREAALLQDFTKRFAAHAKAPEALFRAGLAQEKAKKFKKAEKLFFVYQRKHGLKLGHAREAGLHLGRCLLAQKRTRSAKKWFERCGKFKARRSPAGSELAAAAECRFLLGELVFEEYEKIVLRPPMRRLAKLLNHKATMLKKAEALFAKVVEAGHPEWASAALYRIGDMYSKFARAIYDAPLPKGLSERELEIYRQELQTLAFPIEDKALNAFVISLGVAQKQRYFSTWSNKTLQMLRKLDPAQYPKEEEIRPGTGWADSFTRFPLNLKRIKVPQKPAKKKKGGAS